MQPWGPRKGRQSTLISEHHTVAAAFAAIDHLSSEMVRTRAPSDAVELVQQASRTTPEKSNPTVITGLRKGANPRTATKTVGRHVSHGPPGPRRRFSYNQAQLRWP